jgi:hypothetical protein
MQLDFEVQRSTRRCAATQRALEPGEECYSVLEVAGADVIRKDFGVDAWAGPPDGAFGWWRGRVPDVVAKKIKLAPNEILLQLFDQLAEQPDQADLRYVLALLLIRRRVMRIETPLEFVNGRESGDGGAEAMHIYCPKRDASYVVAVNMPTGDRIDQIQQRLREWLIAGAE